MVIKVKKIIKELLVPIILAILFGFISGKYVYKAYKENLYTNLSSTRLYLLENGIYDSIDNMREENSKNNYIYYKDSDKYKTVVGITNSYDNIDKIKSLYNSDLSVEEYYIETDTIDKRQLEYEKIISSASDLKQVKEAVDNILNLYRSDDNIKLIAIN